jgi:DNA-binding PucR family transcriptional regulator
MPTPKPADLYEEDFYAWTRDQAAALRRLAAQRWNGPLDLDHLAEEVEDLGKTERNAVRSQLRRIIEHCLKLEHSPAQEPRIGWKIAIDDARIEIADHLTAAIRHEVAAELPRLYRDAAKLARKALAERGERAAADSFPEVLPYTLDQLLGEDWYPASRHGIVDEV